jgi:hypothetical protein
MAEDSSGYRCIADIIMETLNDNEWAAELHAIADKMENKN